MRKNGEIFVPQIKIRGNVLLLCIFCNSGLPLSSQINWACDGREDKTQELFIKITVIPGLHTTFITHYI